MMRMKSSILAKLRKTKEKDQKNARINFAKDIDKHLRDNFVVIAIGERFLTKENITGISYRPFRYSFVKL